jgi:hypothetical protein
MSLKRGREEEVTDATEEKTRFRGGPSPPKKTRWHVVKYVQKLLTTYFAVPRAPPKSDPEPPAVDAALDAPEE